MKGRRDTGLIRGILFERQNHRCLWCDKILTWNQAHMHEKIFRSRGGEISLDNSVILCADCHLNSAHKDRTLRFGEKKKGLDKIESV